MGINPEKKWEEGAKRNTLKHGENLALIPNFFYFFARKCFTTVVISAKVLLGKIWMHVWLFGRSILEIAQFMMSQTFHSQ